MISFKQVSKKFGAFTALDNITLDINRGKSYALVGPNGSGKTTLLKCVLGLVVPTSGEITVDGTSIAGSWVYREKIGYMPQIGRYPDNISIGQLLDMMKNIRNSDACDEHLIEEFQLKKIADKKMHSLSGGTRQKVSAALAFLFKTPIVILDEPTAGLDPVSAEILKEKIQRERENGRSFIITSHILNDLDELSTDVIYLWDGKLHYQDSIAALKEDTGEHRLGKAVATLMKQKELMDSINS